MSDLKRPLSCEQFEAHVSDYIDGALSMNDRSAMDAHATECGRCVALLTDVRAIVASAATLAPLSPSRDLWSGIAQRLDTPVVSIANANVASAKRSRTVSLRVFAAAAALLVSLSSVVTYVLARGNQSTIATPVVAAAATATATPTAPPDAITQALALPTIAAPSPKTTRDVATAPGTDGGMSVLASSQPGATSSVRYTARVENSAEFAYEREITAMRRIVDDRLGDLDSVTVVEIERNLRIIDKAISDSRRALENDPRSRFLSKQLDRALENKLDIMRRIALL